MHSDGTKRIAIEANREGVRLTGDVAHSLRVMVDPFFAGLPRLPSKRCVDLLWIAAGVYAVDRLVKKRTQGQIEPTSRTCVLSVQVNDLAFWEQPAIKDTLENILEFLTDESWSLTFEPPHMPHGEEGHQHPLQLSRPYEPSRIALYSGGLDSAAGLANQLISGIDDYVLVTVGHQSCLRMKTRRQLGMLQDSLGKRPLLHSTVITALRGQRSLALTDQERTQRTRSFLFASCAVTAAAAFGVEQIDIFENGVGSINLPLMTGALFGGLTTRGSHPTFLRLMSKIASAICERRIRFALPFATKTKAQMLLPMRENGLERWLQTSYSCIHSSCRILGKRHYGSCPACIERRQAFQIAGIRETDDYSTDIFVQPPRMGPDADYLRLYIEEAHAWLKGDPRPRRRLHTHLRLTDVPGHEDEHIARLYTQHSREVARIFHNAGSA